jgi:hypothetical protein
MRQVDKKRYMKAFLISLAVVIFTIGCGVKNKQIITKKTFDQNLTKDQLLFAAKRVFSLSDHDQYIVDSYRNELNVTKPKATYKLFTMDIQNDNFDFRVDDTNGTMDAYLSISRSYGVNKKDRYYLEKDNFTYTLFWERMEYLLGIKDYWKMCNYIIADGFLCDSVDISNNRAHEQDKIDLNSTRKENIKDINITIETVSSHYKSIMEEKIKNKKNEILFTEKVNGIQSDKINSIKIDDNLTIPLDNNMTKKD